MFLNALKNGFVWSEWQYLLLAVERFAWPMVMVSTFQSRFSNPLFITQLTTLFAPFKWLGLKIDKLQLLILLALRFMPSLKREWERFAHFQTYFMSAQPSKTLIQKLRYGQGVLKAMISHTIYRAVRTGDLLALKGLPTNLTVNMSGNMLMPICFWGVVGTIFYFLDLRLFFWWSGFSVWLIMIPGASRFKEVQ